jgi:hypothetical protein
MTENFSTFSCQDSQFKESVCIDVSRVYDSCADKDCLENLRVNFSESGQHIIDQATSVRVKSVSVITTYVDLEAIPFRKGYYSVDMTFFFEVNLEAFIAPSVMPASVSGLCVFNKKVVLYGSEGNVRVFSSRYSISDTDVQNSSLYGNLPKATVQVADPVALSARLCDPRECTNQFQCRVPDGICRRFGGEFVRSNNVSKTVAVTLGLFTIVQIERNVQMRIPAYDFCIPNKECVSSTDDPCDLFSRIEFPTEEFFPPRTIDESPGIGCGGCRNHSE